METNHPVERNTLEASDLESSLNVYRTKYSRLGHALFLAYIKTHQGVTFATAERNGGSPDEIGLYWLMVAELVSRTVSSDDNRSELGQLLATWRRD